MMTNLLSPQLSAEGQQPHHQLLKGTINISDVISVGFWELIRNRVVGSLLDSTILLKFSIRIWVLGFEYPSIQNPKQEDAN